ncbi:hypothetical protein M3Y99_00041300 [Aphelenchoides fujianensis]|nr:hypothetical protein M3Y99_00041300 [Aphelenchoides fujianensis]
MPRNGTLPQIPETTLVEPPARMVDETPGVASTAEGGCFVLADEGSESPEVVSLDESKKTEGRSTDDAAGFSTEDDLVSLSSTCSSHIAGKWWNGKDTRFLLHCEKEGLQPSPRAEKECELKEKQLVELRDRVKQMDGARELAEDNRLMKLLDEKTKRFEEEKERWNFEREAVTDRLTAEIFDLHKAESKRMERERLVATAEAATMTDLADSAADDLLQPLASGQTTGTNGTPNVHTPNDPNPSASFLGVGQKSMLTGDALNEAYRQEALFFRTKAAELELIVRQHILQQELLVNDAVQTMGPAEAELPASAKDPSVPPRSPVEDLAEKRQRMLKQSMSLGLFSIQKSPSQGAVECQSPVCAEKVRELKDENDNLLEKASLLSTPLTFSWLQMDEIFPRKTAGANLKAEFEELANLAEERLAESLGAQRAFQKLQDKNDTLERAIAFVEAKLQAYQNAILDHAIVVRDEDTSEWRRGFDDPRFRVCYSTGTQTELTAAALSANENEFSLIQLQLRELQAEYSAKQIDLDTQFTEIERNLILKSQLVDQLTRQLEISARDTQLAEEHRQKERDHYREKIEALSRELERLPGLQIEVDRLQQEKSLLEIRLRGVKEEYEDGLGEALKEALEKSNKQERYWLEKMQDVERSRENVKNMMDKLQMDFEELKMRAQIERTDLEQRLASSIEHVGLLDRKLNSPKKDVAVEAKPEVRNKYVACRPNQRHKQVGVERSELPPSRSEENVAELLKYKEALLRTRRRLAQLDPPQAPPRPPPPASKLPPSPQPPVEQPKVQRGTTGGCCPLLVPPPYASSIFKPLRKSQKGRPNLSFGQVHFDSITGVTLPLHGGKKREEDNSDALSFVSLPAIIDHEREPDGYSTNSVESRSSAPPAPIHEEAEHKEEERPEPSVESEVTPLAAHGIQMEARETSTEDEDSIEEIRKMEEHTRRLQDELLALRDRVVEAEAREQKVLQLGRQLPPLLHIGHPPATDAQSEQPPVDRLLDRISTILEAAKPAALIRSSSVPDLNEQAAYEIRPCVQLNAKLRQKLPPRFRPLPIPTAWDNERGELLRQNARYAAQLLALKAKLDRKQPAEEGGEKKRASSADRPQTTEFDVLERELRELAEAISTVPVEHAEQLAVARAQRDRVTSELLGVKQELQDANNELLIYRREPRSDARCSLGGPPPGEEQEHRAAERRPARTAKVEGGLRQAERERADLRMQVAIQKGELELARLFALHEKGERKGAKSGGVQRRPSATADFLPLAQGEHKKSLPDLTLNQPTANKPEVKKARLQRATSHEEISSSDDRLDSSNPLHAELRRAFQKQIAGLREKNRELEGRVVDLENKVATETAAVEPEATIPQEEHEKGVQELKDEIEILRKETEMYEKRLRDQEDLQIILFRKGQQSAEFAMGEDREIDVMTEDRVTLSFLHDAFYHYLISGKGEARDHLQAIMSVLNFTNKQKEEILKRRGKSH